MNKKKNAAGKSVLKTTSYGRPIKDPAKPSSLDPLKVDEAIKKVAALRRQTPLEKSSL